MRFSVDHVWFRTRSNLQRQCLLRKVVRRLVASSQLQVEAAGMRRMLFSYDQRNCVVVSVGLPTQSRSVSSLGSGWMSAV